MKLITKNTAQLKAEVARHIEADAVIQGKYWIERDNAVGGRGCFIGCLTHSGDAYKVTNLYGLPLRLVKVAESIFEELGGTDAVEFFAAIPDAISSDGKDLSLVHWEFLAGALEGMAVPESDALTLRDALIEGLRLMGAGEEWREASVSELYLKTHHQLGLFMIDDAVMINGVDYNAVLAMDRACLSVMHARSSSNGLHYFLNSMKSVIATRARELDISHSKTANLMADLLLKLIADAPITTTEGETA